MLRTLGGRYLLHRWDRAALVVASIALGVATLVSSRILNRCLGAAAARTTTPLRASADLFVSNGELGVAGTVADDLKAANLPGVAAVRPLVFDRVSLPGLGGRPAVLLGAELGDTGAGAEAVSGVRFVGTLDRSLAAAALLLTRTPVVLSKPVHDAWVKVGPDADARGTAPLVVRHGTRSVDCVPVGYFEVDPGSPAADLGRNVVGMGLTAAARLVRPGPPAAACAVVGMTADPGAWDRFARPRVNRVDVTFAAGADPAAVRQAVEAVVGPRAAVRTQDTQGKTTDEIVGGVQVGFTLCSLGAMVVGLFLVYNALSVTVAERRADIGILRSVGATRRQVVGLFAASAAVLGVLGAAAGVPLGVGLARLVLSEFADELGAMFLSADVDPGTPTAGTVVLAVAAGLLTAVFAALVPAVQAAADDPADVVRRSPKPAGGVWTHLHRAAVGVLIGGGVGAILLRHHLPARVGAFGGMMSTLIGLLLAAPLIVAVAVRLTRPFLRAVLPIEARLSADNLTRAPGRTGVVIGALGAGVAVMVQTAGVGRSNEEPVVRWVDEVIQADRFVFTGQVIEAQSSQAPMGPEVVKELAAVPGVEGTVGIRYARPEYNGTIVLVVALDADRYADLTNPRVPGGLRSLALLKQLPGGDRALISENFARRHNVHPGDALTLPGPNGPVPLTVVGTARDYSWSRGTVFVDRAVYARRFGDGLVDVTHVFEDGPEAAAGVTAYADERGLTAVERRKMRQFLADLIDRVYALAYLQQLVVGVVAALGVVTALLISVLQRKRELGLLLAVGATPGQVVRSVLAEAALMGAFGAALGVLIGLPLEWYVLDVVLAEESGFVFDLLFPWKPAVLIAAGSVAIAAVAGLLPAVHAVRVRIPDAIAYE